MISKPPKMEIQQSMLPCNMPLLNFYLLITVTFSTPTPVYNSYDIESIRHANRFQTTMIFALVLGGQLLEKGVSIERKTLASDSHWYPLHRHLREEIENTIVKAVVHCPRREPVGMDVFESV